MSRRQRCAREKAVRSRIARAKVLRRRARKDGARRVATAARGAAVTLAGGTLSTAAKAAPTDPPAMITRATSSAGASPLGVCGDLHTPPSDPANPANVAGTLFFTADDG